MVEVPLALKPDHRQSERGDIGPALEQFPYGIYIVGTVRRGTPNGMIADWVMQVAFQPHRVAISFENDSYSLESIRLNHAFSVNLLAHDDGAGLGLAQRFVQPRLAAKVKGRSRELSTGTYDKLQAVEYTTSALRLPRLAGALMWLECAAEQFIDVGDHTLVVGRALDGKVTASDEPLTSADVPWPYSG
jgi:flavin reductase (DIM6/NTAB) family NADH-FMN oxidoreductase RutF